MVHMRDHGAVEDHLQASWERQARLAQQHDDDYAPSWAPPSFAALVASAGATTLRRFYPFTSHWVLRFRITERFLMDLADIAPGSIALSAGGLYAVQSGLIWAEGANTVLTTADPVSAAATLEGLLVTWDTYNTKA